MALVALVVAVLMVVVTAVLAPPTADAFASFSEFCPVCCAFATTFPVDDVEGVPVVLVTVFPFEAAALVDGVGVLAAVVFGVFTFVAVADEVVVAVVGLKTQPVSTPFADLPDNPNSRLSASFCVVMSSFEVDQRQPSPLSAVPFA